MVRKGKEHTKIGDKLLEEVQEFSYLCRKMTKDERCIREIRYSIHSDKIAFKRQKTLLTGNISRE